MARLQDFSDVTPSSSSDKLLIVQSAGQGLATLDTAGQQIANNTSVSQLNTTRKTLAGAINEHDSEIGDLSQLTTSVTSSLVGAVNSLDTDKVNVSDLTPKTFSTTTPISIQANETVTQQFTVNNAKYGIITGFAITSNLNVVALQFYFYNATTVQVRVKNVSNVNDVFHISFFYI